MIDLEFRQIFDVIPDPLSVLAQIENIDQSQLISQPQYNGKRLEEPEQFKYIKELMQNIIIATHPDIISIHNMAFSLQLQGIEDDIESNIHADQCLLNCIIYLNQQYQTHTGTSMYHTTYKRPSYQTGDDNVSEFNQSFQNRKFLQFQQVFNSMVIFPGYVWHGRDINKHLPPTKRNFFIGFLYGAKVKV